MRTDSIFYRLFQDFPVLLFELLGQDQSQAVGYEFSSREVKELAFRLDGIFIPSDSTRPIYCVEVQFQKDPSFYYRFVAEIAVYLRQYQPAQLCRAVVFYPQQSIDLGIPNALSLFAPAIQRIYLDQLPKTESPLLEMVKVIVEPPHQALTRAQALVKTGLGRNILELLQTVLFYKFAELSREEIEAMFSLSELKQTRVYQEAHQEGASEIVLRLLKRKVGDLPLSMEGAIRALPMAQIEALGDALLEFGALSDVERWLAENSSHSVG